MINNCISTIKKFFTDKSKYNESITIENTFDSEYELKGYLIEFFKSKEIQENYELATLHNFIIFISINSRKVFDVSTFTFSEKVINSVETDRQILTATIDLISILMTGNQFLVTQKHNF